MLASYHLAWLSAHPARSAEWLSAMLADGFDVHHIDGDHSNDATTNLALIETQDHALNIHQLPFTRSAAIRALRARRDRIEEACREAGMEYGSFTSKTVKGRKYWYWQDANRKQSYLGPDFPFMRVVVEEYNKAKARSCY